MKRKKLEFKNKKRLTFRAKVDRFGIKTSYKGYPQRTVCLIDVVFDDDDAYATDHIWFTVGKRLENLKINDYISFDARISSYTKGYVNYRDFIDERTVDYKLNNPTNIVVLNSEI